MFLPMYLYSSFGVFIWKLFTSINMWHVLGSGKTLLNCILMVVKYDIRIITPPW